MGADADAVGGDRSFPDRIIDQAELPHGLVDLVLEVILVDAQGQGEGLEHHMAQIDNSLVVAIDRRLERRQSVRPDVGAHHDVAVAVVRVVGGQLKGKLEAFLHIGLRRGVGIKAAQGYVPPMALNSVDIQRQLLRQRQGEKRGHGVVGAGDRRLGYAVVRNIEKTDLVAGLAHRVGDPLAIGRIGAEQPVDINYRNIVEREALGSECAGTAVTHSSHFPSAAVAGGDHSTRSPSQYPGKSPETPAICGASFILARKSLYSSRRLADYGDKRYS